MNCPVCHSILFMTDQALFQTLQNQDEEQRSRLYICTNTACESSVFNIAWTVGEEDTFIMHPLEAEQDVLL